jgi:hypothetical protein
VIAGLECEQIGIDTGAKAAFGIATRLAQEFICFVGAGGDI